MREGSKKILSRLPGAWEIARRTEEYAKGMLVPGTLFEELGWNYIGPIDGHALPTPTATLRNIRALDGPQFLLLVTNQGKGVTPAAADPIHSPAISQLERVGDPDQPTALCRPPRQSSTCTEVEIVGC